MDLKSREPEPALSKWESMPAIIIKSVGIAAVLTGLAWAGRPSRLDSSDAASSP